MRPITSIIKKNVNCYDLNFIFILAGFAFLTSVYANPVASIAYNGIGTCIALWGLLGFKGQPKFKLSGDYPKIFLLVLVLFWARCLYELIFGEYQGVVIYGKTQGLLFFFGKVLLPLLAFIKGWRVLHIRTCLLGIFFCLSFSLILGLGTLADQAQEYGEDARFSLNASQSSLAFGNTGAFLALVSLCLLFKNKRYFRNNNKLWVLAFIAGAIIGIVGSMKAGSRGPILSLVTACVYLVFMAKPKIKLLAITGVACVVFFSTASSNFIKEFAPALYYRSMNTIEHHDSSGRDILFSKAIDGANANPIFGTDPLIVGTTGIWSYHNVYLNYLMGCGYLAFSIFVIFMLMLLYRVLKFKASELNPLFIFIFSLLIFQTMRGMTGGDMFADNDYNFAVFAAATIVSNLTRKQNLRSNETFRSLRSSNR